jgi:tripeptide aminopeptidase
LVIPPNPVSPLELFLALVRIPSPSGREGQLATAITEYLSSHGASVTVDGSAAVTGSDTGNVIARFPDGEGRATVVLLAHMDTVQEPGVQVEPVVGEDGVVRSGGDTILGADNKAAVAALLWLAAHRRETQANLVLVFTTHEEQGRMGVSALNTDEVRADYVFPVDGSYPIGTIFESALGQTPFTISVRGRSAHAARNPDDGIHAVRVAAEIVAELELGWQRETVANIGTITGGGASNVIPDRTEISGEVRGFDGGSLDERMASIRAVAETVAKRSGATVVVTEHPDEGAPPFPEVAASAALRLVADTTERLGIELHRERCLATLEANFLSAMNLPTIGIASGGREPHSFTESLPAMELDRLVSLLEGILDAASLPPKMT